MYFCTSRAGATATSGSLRLRPPGECRHGQEGELLAVPGERGGGGLKGGEDAGDKNGLQLLAWSKHYPWRPNVAPNNSNGKMFANFLQRNSIISLVKASHYSKSRRGHPPNGT